MTGRLVIDELIRRFDFPATLFASLGLVEHGSDLFVTTQEAARFALLRPVRKGIRLARVFPRGVKPTTSAMQIIGQHAQRSIVDLDRPQVDLLLAQQPVSLNPDVEPGYVIIRHKGLVVGVGLYRSGVLRSQIPVARLPGRGYSESART